MSFTINSNGVLTRYKGEDKEVIIPDNVKEIYDFAFKDCTSVTSIIIPEGVTKIGNHAFENCTNLTSITIPKSLTCCFNSFPKCKITAVYISDIAAWCNLNFGYYPIFYAHNLYVNNELITELVIPDGVTSISGDVFAGCSNIKSVAIPESVESIGSNPFRNCPNLTSITVDENNNNYDSRNNCNAVIDTSTNSLISGCAETVIPDSITGIRRGAFSGSSLTSIVIPGSVTEIDYSAFAGCSSLTNVVIPDSVTKIASEAFAGCSSLTNVVIPDNVTEIDYSNIY